MAAKAEALSDALLNHTLRNVADTPPAAVYVALYTVAPTATTAGTEVTTAGGTLYNRVAVTFNAAASASCDNSGAVTFAAAGASWGTVVAAAIVDNATPGAGNVLYFGNLTVSKAVGIGDQLNFAAGALVVTES